VFIKHFEFPDFKMLLALFNSSQKTSAANLTGVLSTTKERFQIVIYIFMDPKTPETPNFNLSAEKAFTLSFA